MSLHFHRWLFAIGLTLTSSPWSPASLSPWHTQYAAHTDLHVQSVPGWASACWNLTHQSRLSSNATSPQNTFLFAPFSPYFHTHLHTPGRIQLFVSLAACYYEGVALCEFFTQLDHELFEWGRDVFMLIIVISTAQHLRHSTSSPIGRKPEKALWGPQVTPSYQMLLGYLPFLDSKMYYYFINKPVSALFFPF